MKRNLNLFILLLTCIFVLHCTPNNQEKLTIATAANMQFAMKALSEAFTKKTTIECDIVISSSGKLTAQIKEGAPYDIFVSADIKYPNSLQKSGLTEGTPRIYAYGKLVLWTAQKRDNLSLAKLRKDDIKHIALANPKTAPYGEAAIQTLKANGLLDAVQEKLVYGESIAQTNQFIVSGAANVGFTAMSVVKSPNMQKRGSWLALNEKDYDAIAQAVVVIKQATQDRANALKFQDFLFSEEARQILKDFGYSMNE